MFNIIDIINNTAKLEIFRKLLCTILLSNLFFALVNCKYEFIIINLVFLIFIYVSLFILLRIDNFEAVEILGKVFVILISFFFVYNFFFIWVILLNKKKYLSKSPKI